MRGEEVARPQGLGPDMPTPLRLLQPIRCPRKQGPWPHRAAVDLACLCGSTSVCWVSLHIAACPSPHTASRPWLFGTGDLPYLLPSHETRTDRTGTGGGLAGAAGGEGSPSHARDHVAGALPLAATGPHPGLQGV